MIFTHRLVLALALLSAVPLGCKSEPAHQRPPDPELDEIKALLRELDEKPTLARAMASDAAVDPESLPARLAVPEVVEVPTPELTVEAATPTEEPPPVAVTKPLPPIPEPAPRLTAPDMSDPVLACLALYGACAGKGLSTDVCVRDLPRCAPDAASAKGGKACCPADCADSYARSRRHGASVDAAGRAAFSTEAEGCLVALAQAPEEAVPVGANVPPVEQEAQKKAPVPPPPAPPRTVPVAPPKPPAPPPAAPAQRVSPTSLPSVGETAPPTVQSQPVP